LKLGTNSFTGHSVDYTSILKIYKHMKTIFLLFTCLLFQQYLFSQDSTFFHDSWKVKEVRTLFHGTAICVFNKDSATHTLDYTNFSIKFKLGGTYSGKSMQGTFYSGTWGMNSNKDTAVIDSVPFRIVTLDLNNFVTRTYSMQVKDTLGNLDTAYSYFSLYRVIDILTGTAAHVLIDMHVNPVPASTQIHIELNERDAAEIKELRLTSIYGQVLEVIGIDKNTRTKTIDIEQLAPGFYYLTLISPKGDKLGMKKIIKQ
jgi:hypothetical protein